MATNAMATNVAATTTSERNRSAQEVFDTHLRFRLDGALETDLERNYSERVVMFIGDGVFRGHDGVRELAKRLRSDLPQASIEYRTRTVDGEVCFLEWGARSNAGDVDDGVDSFVVRDGKIVAQTIHYTVKQEKELQMTQQTQPGRQRGGSQPGAGDDRLPSESQPPRADSATEAGADAAGDRSDAPLDQRSTTRPDAHPAGSGIAMERAGSTNTLGDGRTAGGARNAHKRDEG